MVLAGSKGMFRLVRRLGGLAVFMALLGFANLGHAAVRSLATTNIDRIEAVGNTLLSPAVLDEVLLPFRGTLGLEQIQEAAQALQAAYRAAGYGAVVVQIPEQTLKDGVVHLDVIEGRLSQIQVSGAHAFSRENILRSLSSLKMGETPNLSELDSELLMVNENPAKAVHVVFQAGEKRAQVEALVIVDEQPVSSWQLSLDNTGSGSSGQNRLTLSYQNANLADADKVLSAQLTTSPSDPSAVAIASINFREPIYSAQTFLEWSAMASNTHDAPTPTSAGDLSFSGNGSAMGLRLIRNLESLAEYKQQLSVGLEGRRYLNDCSLGSFGAAGCGSAAAPVSVLPLTLGYALNKPGALEFSVHWVENLSWDNNDAEFDAARAGAVAHYHVLRANASGRTGLTQSLQFAWRLDGQSTDMPLVSAEQFGLGGSSSVRGYPERALAGDSGLMYSLELRSRLGDWMPAGIFDDSQLSIFVEGGNVADQQGKTCLPDQYVCSLWGAGFGWFSNLGPGASLRMDFARAGVTVNETEANDWRLHFKLNYSF